MPPFAKPPPNPKDSLLSYPAPHVLLVTLNRPKGLNCIDSQGHEELHNVWEWLDAEPSLRVGILTGKGRAFCAGADLKEWNNSANTGEARRASPASGFGGLSRRKGRKPVLAAVNGLCFGGGSEMIINSDMVVASSRAVFGLPEVKRGVVALAGALTRIVRTVGKQRAMEMALTGRNISVEEAERWGLVNEIVPVPDGASEEENSAKVVERAVAVAATIAANSPDAVLVSREGIKLGWESIGADEATGMLSDTWVRRLYEGENIKEGLNAFVEKRKPVWKDSKL